MLRLNSLRRRRVPIVIDNFTEGEVIDLMHKAFDFGFTLFDAADTYGNGLRANSPASVI